MVGRTLSSRMLHMWADQTAFLSCRRSVVSESSNSDPLADTPFCRKIALSFFAFGNPETLFFVRR